MSEHSFYWKIGCGASSKNLSPKIKITKLWSLHTVIKKKIDRFPLPCSVLQSSEGRKRSTRSSPRSVSRTWFLPHSHCIHRTKFPFRYESFHSRDNFLFFSKKKEREEWVAICRDYLSERIATTYPTWITRVHDARTHARTCCLPFGRYFFSMTTKRRDNCSRIIDRRWEDRANWRRILSVSQNSLRRTVSRAWRQYTKLHEQLRLMQQHNWSVS